MRASGTDERLRVLGLLRRHGFNTTSFQVLEDGLSYWWDSGEACVAYADTGTAWVAAGAPLAAAEHLEGVATRFVAAAHRSKRRGVFFASQQRLAKSLQFASTQVGLQPIWDPRHWAEHARRSQLRRAHRKGVCIRRLAADELGDPRSPTRIELEGLIERWLGTRRMSRMSFLVRVQPFTFAEERRFFAAQRGTELVGFLAAVPVYARGGWFLEDLVRAPGAPNGTTEALVDAAMRQAAEEGSRWATLGLAPLAGSVPGWMRGVGGVLRPLYDFSGLHAFKSKFAPAHWEPVFVTHAPEVWTPLAVLDALRAFAGCGLSTFALRTIFESPRESRRRLGS